MNCEIIKEVKYVLTLTRTEATWLCGAMQNPINQTSQEESIYESRARHELSELIEPISETSIGD